MRRFTDLSFIRDGDEALINQPIDVLGVNFYQPAYVSAKPGEPGAPDSPGTEGIAFREPVGPVTDMNWQIEPAGLTRLLERLHNDYGVPLLITENGAAYPDGPSAETGEVHDTKRIEYLDGHLRACHDAMSRGVDLQGILRVVSDGQLRMGRGLREAFRHRARRLRDAGAAPEGQRAVVHGSDPTQRLGVS